MATAGLCRRPAQLRRIFACSRAYGSNVLDLNNSRSRCPDLLAARTSCFDDDITKNDRNEKWIWRWICRRSVGWQRQVGGWDKDKHSART